MRRYTQTEYCSRDKRTWLLPPPWLSAADAVAWLQRRDAPVSYALRVRALPAPKAKTITL